MARIRSIHPGVFTDEAWAAVSIAARWLGQGVCTEADDNGVFEWKPPQLKMRIFPADNVDVPALLTELEDHGIVRRFELDGRQFGALRNFCRFQRPRKPKTWFSIPPELRAFVALDAPGPEPDDDGALAVPQKSELTLVEASPVPPKSEKSPQMEDGGGRREEGEEGPRRRGARLAEDWLPSDADRDFAAQKGFKALEIEHMALKFKNYWLSKSGRDACKRDWSRTWQNWVLEDFARQPPKPKAGGGGVW